ncbi:hypothetical protein ACIQ6Y_14830 [Streptomyces sp. NPDC096205]|uniref:hypothetical protein n=1 Tax=Streptomyces sp. NPDC096205 TaxID=3366081 RepID=UPI00380145AA
MSIMPPSVPVLRGRKKTSLRFDGSALVLSRKDQEHHIPLEAVESVRGEGRAVEVRLWGPQGGRAVVHRVEGIGEAAAEAFAGAVGAALPQARQGGAVVDGSALVTVRTVRAEHARLRKRRWIWVGTLAFLLVHVVETVIVSAEDPALSVLIWMGAFCSGGLGVIAIRTVPFGTSAWRLRRDGIAVIARYDGFVDGMHVYRFSDLTGRPLAYAHREYRGEEVEVVYDPGDPFVGHERKFILSRKVMVLPMLLSGGLGLFMFVGTLLLLFTV